MTIVTGGAGFIGSALIWELNNRGEENILVVDDLDHQEKEKNLAPLKYEQLIGIKEFREKLNTGEFNDQDVSAILHMGACSSTSETDWDYLLDNNVEYSKDIIRWCQEHNVRCIYASSAATYGGGEHGFSDDYDVFNKLKPLNLYGQSKLAVDVWARDGGFLDSAVGLRYFNVYGPNESHKEEMRSVICKKYPELEESGEITLFKSANKNYADGEQERDFIYIKDAAAATLHFLDNLELAGVYNIGTGEANTWKAVAEAMIIASGKPGKISYIDMPDNLRKQYQYHTQADISKLLQSGFDNDFTGLNEAISDYIQNYLKLGLHLGEK